MHQGFSSTSNANSNGGTNHVTLFRFFTYILLYGILVLPYFMMRNLRQTETTVEKSPVDFMFDTMETISYYKVLVNFSKIKKTVTSRDGEQKFTCLGLVPDALGPEPVCLKGNEWQ